MTKDDDPTAEADQGLDSDAEELSEDDVQQLEQERLERLDPENRPVNAEVDNSDRDFDAEQGVFTTPAEDAANGPQIGADRPEGVEVDDD